MNEKRNALFQCIKLRESKTAIMHDMTLNE